MNSLDFYYHFPSCFKETQDKVFILNELIKHFDKYNFDLERYNLFYQHSSEYNDLWRMILSKHINKPLWWQDIYKYNDILLFMVDNDLLMATDIGDIIFHYVHQLNPDTLSKLIYSFVEAATTKQHLPEVKYAVKKLLKLSNDNGKLFKFLYNLYK